jgi:hypothetical protein
MSERKINQCVDCGVVPVESGSYFWKLQCPQCQKARVSIVSRATVIREWNHVNPVRKHKAAAHATTTSAELS